MNGRYPLVTQAATLPWVPDSESRRLAVHRRLCERRSAVFRPMADLPCPVLLSRPIDDVVEPPRLVSVEIRGFFHIRQNKRFYMCLARINGSLDLQLVVPPLNEVSDK